MIKKIVGKESFMEMLEEVREDAEEEIFCNFSEDGEMLEAPTMYKFIGDIVLRVPAGEAIKAEEESGDRWDDVIEAMERAMTAKGKISGGKV